MNNVALQTAIARLGGQSSLAREIGVKQGHVWSWIRRGVPGERVIAVSAATDWHVTPHALRPDLYPNPTDGLPEEIRAQVEAGTWPPKAEENGDEP